MRRIMLSGEWVFGGADAVAMIAIIGSPVGNAISRAWLGCDGCFRLRDPFLRWAAMIGGPSFSVPRLILPCNRPLPPMELMRRPRSSGGR